MNIRNGFLLTFLLIGCKAMPHHTASEKQSALTEARAAMARGEFYSARQITQELLSTEPKDADAEKLMADILDQEISREKEAFDPKVIEEFSPDEKKLEGKTWLERAQALLAVKQYDEALLAAEKVFLYDPKSVEASHLIDEIRKEAYKQGKGDAFTLKHMYEEEIQGRVTKYRMQAKRWVEQGRWGAARMAVEKMLLLVPEDREALALYEKIRAHQKLEQQKAA